MYSVECSKPSKRCWLNGLNNQRITFFHCLKPANMKNRCCIGPVMSCNISPTDGIHAYCGYPKNQANVLLWKRYRCCFCPLLSSKESGIVRPTVPTAAWTVSVGQQRQDHRRPKVTRKATICGNPTFICLSYMFSGNLSSYISYIFCSFHFLLYSS